MDKPEESPLAELTKTLDQIKRGVETVIGAFKREPTRKDYTLAR